MPTVTGYLSIGSSSKRVPQAGAAVPRTGNVPGADLGAPLHESRGSRGRRHTDTSKNRSKIECRAETQELGVI